MSAWPVNGMRNLDLMDKLDAAAGSYLSYDHARNKPHLETGPSLKPRPDHESGSSLWP